jgi:hypothetical protein
LAKSAGASAFQHGVSSQKSVKTVVARIIAQRRKMPKARLRVVGNGGYPLLGRVREGQAFRKNRWSAARGMWAQNEEWRSGGDRETGRQGDTAS